MREEKCGDREGSDDECGMFNDSDPDDVFDENCPRCLYHRVVFLPTETGGALEYLSRRHLSKPTETVYRAYIETVSASEISESNTCEFLDLGIDDIIGIQKLLKFHESGYFVHLNPRVASAKMYAKCVVENWGVCTNPPQRLVNMLLVTESGEPRNRLHSHRHIHAIAIFIPRDKIL